MRLLPPALAAAVLCLTAAPAPAHFHMLLPETASARKGEAVRFVYQWGHPFEHQLFDAEPPAGLAVLTPHGKRADLASALEKGTAPGGDGKNRTVFRLRFTPEQRGDHVFLLTCPPVWMEEEQEFLQDAVKVVLHIQAQAGWDAAVGGFELVPLTRPYGLQPGMVFQAQAVAEGKPLPGALVEVERYNPAPPKELPADEHITRTARTDPNGVVTCTLPEAGWWCVTAQADGGTKERNGKPYPVRRRATLWVFVDEKITPRTEK
jgi:cobalt/nickel transport protein